ncbi:uncharacterized protein BP5553_06824 [Venustampulla echinocandica]|uniref:Uncharacterized protein n=1 Tax=Venustampulla echinocandica TaxID=2656787 RepID=A0A370TL05_9HELO|nr:uncharacterized protein BP5553_06824 [Venustampulla echinocandica]RDL36212.1 hypothetical protein BP5553_06824 [Venustampulla echinocandica]
MSPKSKAEQSANPGGPTDLITNSVYLQSTFTKLLGFLPVVLSTVVSLVILASFREDWRIRNGFYYDWIIKNRAPTQVIVQILAGLLGLALVSPLRLASNYAARRSLARRPISMDQLGLYSALTTAQINWSLPMSYLSALLAFAAFALLPQALWAGALTPVSVLVADNRLLQIRVPAWSNDTRALWSQNWYNYANEANGPSLQTNIGIFSYAVHTSRYSYLINDGLTASTLGGEPPAFAKSDNTNYTYHGRSYGAGSSVGLNDSFVNTDSHITSYEYLETAYQIKYNCIYNGSLYVTLDAREDAAPVEYYAHWDLNGGYLTGSFWNGSPMIVAAMTVGNGFLINALGYSQLQNVSCTTKVVPTIFRVAVDVIQKSITVTPVSQDSVKNVEQTNTVAAQSTDSMGSLSMISTTSFTSLLGDMLVNNIFRVQQQNTNETVERKNLRGIEESANAIYDQAFIGAASAQLVLAQEYSTQNVTAVVQVLAVGEAVYIYLVTALNLLVLAGLSFEAFRTRLWLGLPKLDFVDTRSAVIASSAGGIGVSESVEQRLNAHGRTWDGAAGNRIAGKIKVMLTYGLAGPSISLN